MPVPTPSNRQEPPIFWAEIAPCDHLVQVYEQDSAFLDALEGFVGGGLRAGEGVIVIATPEHRNALDARLRARGIDVAAAVAADQYIALDAEEALSRFMVPAPPGGSDTLWPDDTRFSILVTNLLVRAGQGGRRVRAFGEMVALLWAEGHEGATLHLERLWNRFCQERAFCLFCAYPGAGLRDRHDALKEIFDAHSRVVSGSHRH